SLECFGSRRKEEGIVVTPDRECGRPLGSEIFLELRVERYVARIVQEKVELDLVVARPGQQCGVEFIRLRCQERCVLYAMRVLPLGRFGLEELTQCRTVCFVWRFPVLLNWVPAFTQSFLVGIAVLRNDCGDPVRVLQCKTETYGSSVVENVQCKVAEANLLDESANGLCQLLKGVAVLLA